MAPMGPSTEEIEVKLPFPTPAEAARKIEGLGADTVHPRHFEDNIVYDFPSGDLRASGRLLRLRRSGPGAFLTFKRRIDDGSPYKVRTEHETSVDDAGAAERILGGLGFQPVYRYQKYRTVYRLEGVVLSVDETPIGCFVEVEGDPDAIDRVAARLGFSSERYIRATYRDLHEAAAAASGATVGDLVFPSEETSANS